MNALVAPEDLIRLVHDVSVRLGTRTYVVGGAVRDLLLGEASALEDLDFTVEGDAWALAEEVRGALGGELVFHERFLTAKLSLPSAGREGVGPTHLDFARTRLERYSRPGALPEVGPSTLEEDLGRRDFSINAMALPLEALREERMTGPWKSSDRSFLAGEVVDRFGGLEDLRDRRLRILHEKSFLDDPTRILRGFRYASRLEGTFEPETRRLLAEAIEGGAVSVVSANRLMNEARRVWSEPNPLASFRLMATTGFLRVFPGMAPDKEAPFLEALERLLSRGEARRTSSGFDAFVRLLDWHRSPEASPLLGSSKESGPLAWKRKRLGRMERERETLPTLDLRRLPDDSLLFWWAIGAEPIRGFEEALAEKGLL